MRILYVHQFFNTLHGSSGGARSYQLARELVNMGHEVHVLCGFELAQTREHHDLPMNIYAVTLARADDPRV